MCCVWRPYSKFSSMLGRLDFCFRVIVINSWLIFSYDLFEEVWWESLLAVLSKSCPTSTQNSFHSCDSSHGVNFSAAHFVLRSSITIPKTHHRIVGYSSNSCTVSSQFLFLAAYTHSDLIVITHWVISKGLLNLCSSFYRWMFKFYTRFNTNSLILSFTHYQCDSHRQHIFTQQSHSYSKWIC